MIQQVLIFLLGFLCAAFLAALLAPPVWRRAVALTRKRIEASVPLSLPEIQADKDRVRAEFAMATRRLEMNVKSEREKTHQRMLELSEIREAMKKLTAKDEERQQVFSRLEAHAATLQSKLDEREGQVKMLSGKLEEVQRTLEIRNEDLDRIGRLYEDASFAASSRQIELVARESEIEKLGADVASLRSASREADSRHREIAAESRLAQEALRDEKKRYADLESKYQSTQSSLIEHEERLQRRDQELARLREKLKLPQPQEITAPNAEPRRQDAPAPVQKEGSTPEARISTERDRLVERLKTLARENRKDGADAGSAISREDRDQESARLRDEIGNLAATLVRLTAAREGPESPIVKTLASTPGASETPGAPLSLADRIRALPMSVTV